MPILHLLGTGAAISDPERTTTMLALEDDSSVIVIDCGGDVIQRLFASRVEVDKITAMILTHEHPDHVAGFPLFMEKIWLTGRRKPIDVYGIRQANDQARRIFEAFDTSDWLGMPEIIWHEIEHVQDAPVLSDDNWQVSATPGIHAVPVIGLRFMHKASHKVLSYSCDTEKSDLITALAKGSDILVHEATGGFPTHSSANDAAQVAKEAEVARLILVHLPPEALLDKDTMLEAMKIFPAMLKGDEGGRYTY